MLKNSSKNTTKSLKKKAEIGFFDEFSPQNTANTHRLRSLTQPVITKDTTRLLANHWFLHHTRTKHNKLQISVTKRTAF